MPERDLQSAERQTVPGFVDVVAFGCELALLGVLAVAGWGLFGPLAARIGLAVALPVAAGGLWGVWMAPTSRRRLADPARLVAQVVLFWVTAALAAAAGLWVLGLAFAVTATAVFALTRRSGGVTGS